MEEKYSKLLTLTYAVFGVIAGISFSLLLKSFGGVFGWISVALGNDWFRHGLPVLVGFAVFAGFQFHPRVLGWSYEVLLELERVVWPPRKDSIAMTWAVLIMVLLISLVIAVFDFVSAAVLRLLIQ